MPKSTKHKKARVADFSKAKLKLGKGKQIAANATNTNITSRSIALPQQSLLDPSLKAGIPVSRRNHTLPELIVQTRHYSAGVKKEALLEICQLLDAYPHLLQQHLLALVSSLSHLVADSAGPVRSQTRTLLADVFERLDDDQIRGVSRGLALFTLSALSSLEEGIRLDALKVLDMLLEKIPDEITRGWDYGMNVLEDGPIDEAGPTNGSADKGDLQDRGLGAKVVQSLLGVLRIRSRSQMAANGSFTTAAASSDLSPSSRLAVLSTLATFLDYALSPNASSVASTSTTPWYLSTSFSSLRSYNSFLAATMPSGHRLAPRLEAFAYDAAQAPLLMPIDSRPPLAFATPTEDYALSNLCLPSLAFPQRPTKSSTVEGAQASLLSLLLPTLLSSFLDSAPSAFSPSSVLSAGAMIGSSSSSSIAASGLSRDLATVQAVISTAHALYWRELGGQAYTTASSQLDSISAPSNSTSNSASISSQPEARKSLLTLLTHAAAYFPFTSYAQDGGGGRTGSAGGGGGGVSGTESDALMKLNLTFASLVSLLVLDHKVTGTGAVRSAMGTAMATASKRTKTRVKRDEERDRKVEGLVQRVREWVGSALRGELTTATYPMGVPLSAAAYTALEPTLWSLMNQQQTSTRRSRDKDANDAEEDDAESDMFTAVLAHFDKAGAGSESKSLALEFIKRTILVQTDAAYQDQFMIPDEVPKDSPIGKWTLQSVPKYLWQLQDRQPAISESILAFLLVLAHQAYASKGLFSPTTLSSGLAATLAPFFSGVTPASASAASTSSAAASSSKAAKPFYGPFVRLPLSAQRMALDLAGLLVELLRRQSGEIPSVLANKLDKAVSRAVDKVVADGQQQQLQSSQLQASAASVLRERWNVTRTRWA